MARPRKKRKYTRRADVVVKENSRIEKLQEVVSALENQLSSAGFQIAALNKHVAEVSAQRDKAITDLNFINESIRQHQRTLELRAQSAIIDAQQGRDFVGSMSARSNKQDKEFNNVVRVDGFGRPVDTQKVS